MQQFCNVLSRLYNNKFIWLAVTVVSSVTILSWSIYENIDFIYPFNESYLWLKFYLSDADFAHKIFDYRFNETIDPEKVMRFRELSNFFNFTDAQLMVKSAQLGIPHFLSTTFYVAVLAIIVMSIFFTYKYISKRFTWISLLLSLVYLTAPTIFWGGFYFRSSKILAALGICIMIWIFYAVYRAYQKEKKVGLRLLFALGLTAVASMLTDEQAIGGVGTLFVISFIYTFATLDKVFLKLNLTLLFAGIIIIIYRSLIAPWIILQVVGYLTPGYAATDKTVVERFLTLQQLFLTFGLFLRYIATSLGNIPTFIATIPLLIMVFIANKGQTKEDSMNIVGKWSRARKFIIKPVIIILVALISIYLVLHIALLRTNDNLMARQLDSLRYYPTPIVTAWFVGSLFLIYRLINKYPKTLHVTEVILALILILNIAAIPSHKRFLTKPEHLMGTYYGESFRILTAIRNPHKHPASFGLSEQAIWVVDMIREKLSL